MKEGPKLLSSFLIAINDGRIVYDVNRKALRAFDIEDDDEAGVRQVRVLSKAIERFVYHLTEVKDDIEKFATRSS